MSTANEMYCDADREFDDAAEDAATCSCGEVDCDGVCDEEKEASKHTPGPWKIKGSGPRYCGFGIADSDGRSIAAFPTTQKRADEEKVANANLIVTAPKMLAAAKALVEQVRACPGNSANSWEELEALEAIIAEARGGS